MEKNDGKIRVFFGHFFCERKMSGWLDGRQDEILSGKEIGFETLWREK